MSKAVDIEGLSIRPVPTELFEKAMCTNCKKNAARWEFAEGAHPAFSFACSICFLYEVPQLREQRSQVEFLTEGIERKILSVFPRDSLGRLSRPEDADRVSFGIVMADRFMKSKMRGGFAGGFA